MFKFNYYRAKTVQDVCEQLALHKDKIRIIAGGTDIMVQIREKDDKWKSLDILLDITSLEQELRFIREDKDAIYIGTLCTHTDIEKSEIIQKKLSFLGSAAGTVGSPQIRNLGTIGGSICNASPAADPLTPLIASNTRVIIQGLEGTREVDLKEFYLGKGAIDLKEGEFLTTFVVPKLDPKAKTAFVKLGRRKALAISRLNVSAILVMDEFGTIVEACISPGCIFAKPDRVSSAEEVVIGHKPSKDLFAKAGRAVSDEMIKRTGVRWSTEYKQPAVEGLVEDALMLAAEVEVSL